ncbi:hypothetical protein EBR43_03375 [bacterium]|nr:hypothetical protein [bacterium]
MKFDRFDFEQQLLECWNITKDIKALCEAVCDRNPAMTEDEITNVLIGLEYLYELKFNKLWSMFENGVRTKHITGSANE